MKKVSGSQFVTSVEASEKPLPAQIQEALGELVGAAREGLRALRPLGAAPTRHPLVPEPRLAHVAEQLPAHVVALPASDRGGLRASVEGEARVQ